ncbi:unnamed protein product [Symbiodinium sp. CCMP2592]|nr:unnamed protein product [Symbiodinium sp. CCMP2592]
MSQSSGDSARPPALKRSRYSLDLEDYGERPESPEHGDVLPDVPKPRNSTSSRFPAESLPYGPKEYSEIFDWNHDVISRLLEKCGPCRPQATSSPLSVELTTSFSGLGAAEFAATAVQSAMHARGIPVDIKLHSQTEVDKQCRPFLKGQHVFSDVQDRVGDKVVKSLASLQARYVTLFENAKEKLDSKDSRQIHQLVEKYGLLFLQAAIKCMDRNRDSFKASAECLKCGHQCPWAPVVNHGHRLWVEVAGHPCTPWSKRGRQLGFLDPESISALVWAFSLRLAPPPDCIVNENVGSFPAEVFFSSMFPGCRLEMAVFSPCDLGIPTHRPRRYSLVWPNPMSATCEAAAFDVNILGEVCFRRLHLHGSVYLQSPEDEVIALLDGLAAARGLEPRGQQGKSYSCKHVLATGHRLRMMKHREKLEQDEHTDFDFNVDCAQDIGFTGAMRVMPTLVKNSNIYNLRADRLYTVQELMSVQGFPVHRSDSRTHPCMPDEQTMQHIITMGKKYSKTVLGNTMCLCQVGTALAIVFMAAARANRSE